MQISYTPTKSVEIKSKQAAIKFEAGVTVGTHTIHGPGEYDVSGVQCECSPFEGGLAFFVRTEDLVTTYVTKVDASVSKLDGVSEASILILELRSDDTPDAVKALVKAVEPSYVLLCGAGATKELAAGTGFPILEGSSLKVTRAGLPLEGTSLLLAD